MSANSSRLGLKLFVVLLVLAGAGVAIWQAYRPVVQVVVVRAGTAPKIVAGTVVVTPEKITEIRSEAEGRLLKSELAPGKAVKQGEALAEIDPQDVDIEIKHNEDELASLKKTIAINDQKAELAWTTAQEEFDEQERLHKIQSLADVPFEKAKREFETKKQERKLVEVANAKLVEAIEHTLATLRLQKLRTTVTAPFDGVISQVNFHPGALIEKKQALATIITSTRLVIGKISEEHIADVQLGQPGFVRFLGYGEERFSTKVTKKLPTIEEATQRYLIYLDVAIPPERLTSNLTGDIAITIDERQAQALIPRRALFDGRFVYVITDGRIVRREVKVGYTSLTAVEVLTGLRAGEQVIADDSDKFAEGDRVRTETVKW